MSESTEGVQVLVTGAAGFIGTHVVKLLQEAGYKVRGTVRSLANEGKVRAVRDLCPTARYPVELVEALLCEEDGWASAVKDCQYVLHVASPIPVESLKSEDEVIKPAVEGTLNVLRACAKSGTVKRVVLTSSIVAVYDDMMRSDGVYTEEDWTDVSKPNISAYAKSKTLAERAAWDFIQSLPEEEKFELTSINPGFVLGPVLCGGFPPTASMVKTLLERQISMVPRHTYTCVDIRDVASAHVRAMTCAEAAGHRHLLVESPLWLSEMGSILAAEFSPHGYNPPTMEAPNFVIRFAALFIRSQRDAAANLDVRAHVNAARMRDVLGITSPTDVKSSLIDMAYSLIEAGLVTRTAQYKGRAAITE